MIAKKLQQNAMRWPSKNAVEQSLFSKVPLQILGHAMNMYNTALYAYGDDVRALNLEIDFFLE